ncbi:hypothetical protein [Marinicella gelatinilytica]|uniref:hypothetical protein n=1 Tax=Marinicella gelatinilytica TaxID=2996017 RepID=UPI002260A84E|nr:hypothetical protein [Marinicella gelatinilytica]MCX7543838.1 hypothetical protein [Marinicella gelatinilytica]
MPSHSQETQNSRKFAVGNAFIACVLAVVLLAFVMPIGIVIFSFIDGGGINIFSIDFLSTYFMISLFFGFYGLILSTVLGVPTLLVANHLRLNHPLLLFVVGSIYVILILAVFAGGFDFIYKSALIWFYIFCGGICGFLASYLFNKKCQQQLAD